MSLKIIFMGTPEFAVPSLRLLNEKYSIHAVVTQPDRPMGRGLKVSSSPIKVVAKKLGLRVLQPESPKDREFMNVIEEISPEVIVVVGYGHILRRELFEMPRLGCINLHASLLPKYRGAAPVEWALIRGEKKTGVTTIKINEKMDAGDILLQKEIEIGEDEDAGSLRERLSVLGAEVILETLMLYSQEGEIHGEKQDEEKASYAPKITDDVRKIIWTKGNIGIVNLIRGLAPSPGAICEFRGEQIKILKADVINFNFKGFPGEVNLSEKRGLFVHCGDGSIEILLIQSPGRKVISGIEFISGKRIKSGEKFV